ncbi:hypothetical protein GQ607_001619, partial [Colletotrichum asianum]
DPIRHHRRPLQLSFIVLSSTESFQTNSKSPFEAVDPSGGGPWSQAVRRCTRRQALSRARPPCHGLLV